MSSYHGLCSYPHGGRPVSFLWFALVCATICTCYSISSCRLVVLTFNSNLGHFEDHFWNIDELPQAERHQVGLGLFTWLRPSWYVDGDDDTVTRAEVGNWRAGSCVGYNTLQLEDILDPTFESVRILGVASILISFSVFLYSLMLSCLAIANWQRYILALCCLLAGIVNGLVLLMLDSDLCNSMGTSGESKCVMDQGGLVSIAAVILWICAALLTYFFIEPVRQAGKHDKMVAQRQSQKRQASLDRMRKENKVDWNNSGKGKNSKKGRSKSLPSSNAKKGKKEKKVFASFSLPRQRSNDMDDEMYSDAAQKSQKQRHSSSTPKVHAAAPIMLQPVRQLSKNQGAATNKSLETRYLPRTGSQQSQQYREEKKIPDPPTGSSSSYDYSPVDSQKALQQQQQHNNSAAYRYYNLTNTTDPEQAAIIQGVSQKLAGNNNHNMHSENYMLQATENDPLGDPPGLNRSDSRSMLSSLTSPSFGTQQQQRQQQRQSSLSAALADDLTANQSKLSGTNNGGLCCGVGV